jgi:hypothetical protein
VEVTGVEREIGDEGGVVVGVDVGERWAERVRMVVDDCE